MCSCQGSTGSGGSGGGSGTGGVKASGGGSGSGGTGSGGISGGQTTTGQFTIIYDGSLTKTLSTCYSCTVIYLDQTNTTSASFVFTAGTGNTSVSMTIRSASAGGNEISVALSESDPAVPASLRGTYFTTPNYVLVGSSCVSFTTLTLGHGGAMAGSLDCTLSGGDDTAPHPAVVQGTFTGTTL
jgi:hypothetical protein